MIIDIKTLKNQKNLRILGVDWGSVRIGIAGSDDTLTLASPIAQIQGGNKALEEIFRIIQERNVNTIIFGTPLDAKGNDSKTSLEVKKFAEKLDKFLINKTDGKEEFQIGFFDERMSSYAVESMLVKNFDYSRGKRKKIIDKLSAVYILQNFLDYLKN